MNLQSFKNKTGLSYLGAVSVSSKLEKSEKDNYLTYCIYLAPSTLSGHNVCPNASEGCIVACLYNSGHNKIDTSGRINKARIKKTKLFYEDREMFMDWLILEIKSEQTKAIKKGFKFAVRLNGTSDLPPTLFKKDGKNILEIFPDIQFYDYTKSIKTLRLQKKYSNYHVTFSRSESNDFNTNLAIQEGYNVAVVFDELPEFYLGKQVINGDLTDLRFKDPDSIVVGLKFKKVKDKSSFNSDFVVKTKINECITVSI